jgi:uncharacterized protein
MSGPDAFTRYVILLRLNPGQSLNGELVKEHVKHLRELDRDGRLVLCGPFVDYKGGMIIIKAASYEEADETARKDPFVSSGAESYELRTWELSCEDNNHLGAG